MKDVEEAESRRALASIEMPAGDITMTRHVINNNLDLIPTVACVVVIDVVEGLASA